MQLSVGRARLDLDDGRTAFRLALALTAILTFARVAALFASPLELYPDEAQYWLWSRALHWGYVSKPPMIAWLIRATTAIGGEREAWVRLGAPLVHAGAMLALYPVGRRLYGPAIGLLATALYGLMPAVQVSALFIATDAPLMLFLALSLWAYAEMYQRPSARERRWLGAAAGVALGLAFMAKLAAVYLLIGALLHALLDRDARKAWSGWAWAPALAGLAVVFAPNLAWQQAHGFATVAHTAQENARWNLASLIHPGELAGFLVAQLGVFGPIPFAALVGGAAALGLRRRLTPADRLLLCLALPPLALASIQAFVSHAHAHWGAAAYLPGSVLVAAWLVRWRARAWSVATLVLQGAVAALLLAVVAAPQIADATGNGRRLARVRGWAETAGFVTGAARREAGLTAVAVEDRYMFNELAYYGRGYFASPGSAPLRMRPAAQALNEAELSSPLTPQEAGRVLVAESAGLPPAPALPGDFARLTPAGRRVIPLGGGKTREIVLWIGEGYRPLDATPPAGALSRPPHTALITRSLPQPSR
jgi:4-amino-4-deoxy-L-arabinose transferase-like glycosyltransferase